MEKEVTELDIIDKKIKEGLNEDTVFLNEDLSEAIVVTFFKKDINICKIKNIIK